MKLLIMFALALGILASVPAWAAEPRIGQDDYISSVSVGCPSIEDVGNYHRLELANFLYFDGPEQRGFRDTHKCKMLQEGQSVKIQRIDQSSYKTKLWVCVQVIGPNLGFAGIVTPEEKSSCYWIYRSHLEGRFRQ